MSQRLPTLLVGIPAEDRSIASAFLTRTHHEVSEVDSLAEAEKLLGQSAFDRVFFRPAGGVSAFEGLKRIAQVAPGTKVVLACGEIAADTVLEAWRGGAADVINLPLTEAALEECLSREGPAGVVPVGDLPEKAGPRFHWLDENGLEQWRAIQGAQFTLGRGSENDIVVRDPAVSRRHAEVKIENGVCTLHDLGSKHGIYVNDTEMPCSAVLRSGDRVRLGAASKEVFTFHDADLLQTLLRAPSSSKDHSLPVRGFRDIGNLLASFRALSSISLLDDLLSLVVDTAIDLTGAERGFIMLKEGDDSLKFRCARTGNRQPLDGSFFQTSRRVPDEVFRTGHRVAIKDLEYGDMNEDHDSTRQLGLRSIVCVPLRYQPFLETISTLDAREAETIGVLYLDSRSVGGRLSDTRFEALDSLASEAAMAIYNAHLYRESQEKRRMEEELAIAREIQQSLLSAHDRTLPFITARSCNLPCHEVGGDYFEYFDMPDGRFSFALGDVAGKGISAALLATMLHGIFSAESLLELPLPRLIANVNSSLAKRSTGNRFVTFFFGAMDPQGCCAYVNAGHNPPILVGRDGSLRELHTGGLVLGLFPSAQYEAGSEQLQPGDHLVLVTDGVLEARNAVGEEFGETRLKSLLLENAAASSDVILNALKNGIRRFSQNTPQHDDITMMVLGYRE